MKEFNTVTDDKLPEIKIDGELFNVRPIGAGLLLDIEELISKFGDSDDANKLKATKELFSILEGLLIQKGDLTAKEVIRRVPLNKLTDLINVLIEV